MKNYGFIPDIIQPEDYVFGGITKLKGKILAPDRDWRKYMPAPEAQAKKIETMNCTVFGTLNCIEILFKAMGFEKNYSERYTGILAGTTKEGNSPHRVAETIRKFGVISEELLPFDDSIDSWEKYYFPNPLPSVLLTEGQQWIREWNFGHEWVPPDPDSLYEALQFSPLGVSVYAWKERNGSFYKEPNDFDNHWTALIVGADKGICWFVFDSYEQTVKRLEWQYPFGFAKRYTLESNIISSEKISILRKILRKLADIMPFLQILVRKKVEEKKEMDLLKPNRELIMEKDTVNRQQNLVKFCEAIRKFEGWFPNSRAYRNHNPGNLKFTSYTRSLGALTKDDAGFCIFRTDEDGWNALLRFVLDAKNNMLKDYKNKDIYGFFAVYAPVPVNNSKQYAAFVGKHIGVSPDSFLKDIV